MITNAACSVSLAYLVPL